MDSGRLSAYLPLDGDDPAAEATMLKFTRVVRRTVFIGAVAACAAMLGACSGSKSSGNAVELTNVSYDPTRELYQAINPAFAAA